MFAALALLGSAGLGGVGSWAQEQGPRPAPDPGAWRQADCEGCHVEGGWTDLRAPDPAVFDHATTGFPLTAGHARAACGDCHGKGLSALSLRCDGCHDDPHAGGNSRVCESCHDARGWDVPRGFALHEGTRFPLSGVHASISCEACHRGGRGEPPGTAPTECVACHEAAMPTRYPDHTLFGLTDCGLCHSTQGFLPARFVHQDFTAGICVQCHQAEYDGTNHAGQGFGTDCDSCHTPRSWAFVHGPNTAGQCTLCHQDDYDATTAPNHAARGFGTDCEACHRTTTWAFVHLPSTAGQCATCHMPEYDATTAPLDHNALGISTACDQCHSNRAWRPATYVHDAYVLQGAHTVASCNACHGGGVYSGLASGGTDCYACHAADYNSQSDHVANGYSHDCTRCHPSLWTWDD